MVSRAKLKQKMITKLNLATKPFRNRTLPYVLALFLLAFAVAGAIISFAQLSDLNYRTETAKLKITEVESELNKLKGESEKVQQQLTPEQRSLLIAAHKLVANKSFGWSRLFADLEQILPGGVSVSRISIQNVFQDGGKTKAELDFGVLSRDYQNVITMIDNMNSSRIFQAELRGQDRQKTERTTYTEYSMRLIYSPNYNTSPQEREVDVVQGGTQ